jgi:hypothetical protein
MVLNVPKHVVAGGFCHVQGVVDMLDGAVENQCSLFDSLSPDASAGKIERDGQGNQQKAGCKRYDPNTYADRQRPSSSFYKSCHG